MKLRRASPVIVGACVLLTACAQPPRRPRYPEHVNGLTALGVTSEAARLSEGERALVLETVVDQVRGRVPVVAGTTADGLATCVELSRRAQSAGAAAVMVS